MRTLTLQSIRRGALAASLSVAALATTVASADAITLTSFNCGTVAANGSCATSSIKTNMTRCTLFRLTNGSGVNHRAKLFDVLHSGTSMDVYSPSVSLNDYLAGGGDNLSSSPHNYMIFQVTC